MAFMMPVIKNNYEILPVGKDHKKTLLVGGKPKSYSVAISKSNRPPMTRQYSKSFSSMATNQVRVEQPREMSDLNSERLAQLRIEAKRRVSNLRDQQPNEQTPMIVVTPPNQSMSMAIEHDLTSSSTNTNSSLSGKSNFWSRTLFRNRRKSVSSKSSR